MFNTFFSSIRPLSAVKKTAQISAGLLFLTAEVAAQVINSSSSTASNSGPSGAGFNFFSTKVIVPAITVLAALLFVGMCYKYGKCGNCQPFSKPFDDPNIRGDRGETVISNNPQSYQALVQTP